MLELYKESCEACSKIITNKYSTSFSLGIKVFKERFRTPIYNIYGFVRFADEIVDTFHGYDKAALLQDFRNDTFQAINQQISLNPILEAFQQTVNQYQIESEHINAFLDSMAMDLIDIEYDDLLLQKYIYGSAEVVGLMCLRVFCEGDTVKYDELKDYAISLGSAFQKINFLRDLKADFEEKGRLYFPEVDFKSFSDLNKKKIEDDIQSEFEHALIGIRKLPDGVRLGVFLAYNYYISLFNKIKKAPAAQILEKRFRINDGKKMLLLASSAIRNRLNIL